mgnify:CR=1 FL=1|jgi:endonuclease/exonuclease/phosphatase family metal-dependent hydrolase
MTHTKSRFLLLGVKSPKNPISLRATVSRHLTPVPTPPARGGVIDHILYNTSAGAKVTDGGIIELKNPLSDHKPIWAQIVFPRNLEKVKLDK